MRQKIEARARLVGRELEIKERRTPFRQESQGGGGGLLRVIMEPALVMGEGERKRAKAREGQRGRRVRSLEELV